MKEANYDPKKIEKKWQKYWESKKLFQAVNPDARSGRVKAQKPKYYTLVEFPYPSGDGLHVGHVRSYTALDVVARKRRMEGYNVLYPMGWDAFGLPTENYAVKTGIQPAIVTKKNSDNFRRQIKLLGTSFDWSREINTTDPNYYKWTQWIFLQFFKKGLAYKAKAKINWCPSCKIGLANEEVLASENKDAPGKCERCGTQVEEREKEQWMLGITKYADRLDKDLDIVDYPERVKTSQRNWIGRKEGWEIEFKINPTPEPLPEGEGEEMQEPSPLGRAGWGYETADPKIWRALQDRALEMRKNPTEAEDLMWQVARNNSLGCHFRRQQIIGKFIVDFICLEKKLVVEVDGDIHDYQKEADRERTDFLKVNGYKVVRFKNDEVVQNKGSVKNKIAEVLKALSFGEGLGGVLKIFTTRPETIYGATFIARAGKQDKFTGEYAINPATQEKIPIWEAEYIMEGVGSGAIMGVPAHDERDFEFAKKHNIPLQETVIPIRIDKNHPPKEGYKKVTRQAIHAIVKNPKTGKILTLEWTKFPWRTLVIGGVEEGEDVVTAATREIREETGYKNLKFIETLGGQVKAEFFAAHKNENRVSYTTALVFELIDEEREEVSQEEKGKYKITWGTIDDVNPCAEIDVWKERLKNGVGVYTGDGELINSGQFTGRDSFEAKEAIVKLLEAKQKTTYKLRDWVFSRQRYWGEPIPLVFCPSCAKASEGEGWQAVPEKDLPVILPKVKDFKPTENGDSPLAKAEKWLKVKCPKCKAWARRETDVMPNWAGSSWYYIAYLLSENLKSQAPISKQFSNNKVQKNLKYWLGVDWYNGGMEHTTLHLLYSRFWHKFLYDQKLVPGKEPYRKRTSHGFILAPDGQKMSKSRGNVINPDDLVNRFGADALRLYEMFIGPFEQMVSWNEDGLVGTRRFLEKVWRIGLKVAQGETLKMPQGLTLASILNECVKKVGEDIEAMKFNTCVSELMITLKAFEAPTQGRDPDQSVGTIPLKTFETFLKILSPFAPHLAEELWQKLGHKTSITLEPWPKVQVVKKASSEVKIMIQINGKVRDEIVLPPSLTQAEVSNLVIKQPLTAKWLKEKEIKKTIFIPNRLINFVIDN